MSPLRAHTRRLAGVLLLALVSLGATRGSCPMRLAPPMQDSSAHGCCGEGITSRPPSCCDATVRTPDATPRESGIQPAAPPARSFGQETLPFAERGAFSGSVQPLAIVHGPPHTILRI